jgi:hypothetical protein
MLFIPKIISKYTEAYFKKKVEVKETVFFPIWMKHNEKVNSIIGFLENLRILEKQHQSCNFLFINNKNN